MSGVEPLSSGTSSVTPEITEMKEKEQQIPIDDASFAPDRFLYILPNNLFSKEIKIIDVTSGMLDGGSPYMGGGIDDPFRTRARALARTREHRPLYTVERPHWYSRESTMYLAATLDTGADGGGDRAELCRWRQSHFSCGRAALSFPPGSPHSSHAFDLTHPHWYQRTNVWVQDSMRHDWTCDGRLRSNRMTLHRLVGGRREVGARYAQRWGSWVAGGVLLVDTQVVDEVIAAQTAVVMLRRMQQRAMESAKYSGAGS